MVLPSFSPAIPVQERPGAHSDVCVSLPDIPALNARAVATLRLLFNERKQLFAERGDLVRGEVLQHGFSRPRSMVALLGLQHLARSGASISIDVERVRESIIADFSWVKSLGHLGLLTWFTAECVPAKLEALFKEFDFGEVLRRYSDGRQGQTRGLAWFLAGLAHARLATSEDVPDLTDVAVDAYHMLERNQDETGLFGHLAVPRSPRHIFCTRFGTFRDQIHAIYALSKFASAFDVEEPLESALNCTNSLCALQGTLGEWWFLYDKRRRRVVNHYPVFSAHQDGIGPLGLMAVEEATGQSFLEPIVKSLLWGSRGEGFDALVEGTCRSPILESIEAASGMASWREVALNLLKITPPWEGRGLRFRREVRPDHAGWLLCAFAHYGLPKAAAARGH